MDVVLLTNQSDFVSVLPTLEIFALTVRLAPLGDGDTNLTDGDTNLTDGDTNLTDGADVAIIDARTDLVAARSACRHLRASRPALAVVAVVAPANFVEVDIDWNFDDVLLAAAGPDELQARLRLALTRRRKAIDGTLQFGDLILHPASYSVSLSGKDLGLTFTEFKLLSFLVQHAGRAFSRTRLMHEVWGYEGNGRVRTVDVHVRRLRAKLGTAHESMVDTVRGVGYMAVSPPRPPRWIVGEPVLNPV